MIITKKPVQPDYSSRLTVVHKMAEQKDQDEEKNRKAKDPFKKWKMPEQPEGYIKGKKNDSL